jgi:hypothetical protein
MYEWAPERSTRAQHTTHHPRTHRERGREEGREKTQKGAKGWAERGPSKLPNKEQRERETGPRNAQQPGGDRPPNETQGKTSPKRGRHLPRKRRGEKPPHNTGHPKGPGPPHGSEKTAHPTGHRFRGPHPETKKKGSRPDPPGPGRRRFLSAPRPHTHGDGMPTKMHFRRY